MRKKNLAIYKKYKLPDKKYKPLAIIFAIIIIAAIAVNYSSLSSFMHLFMGMFFVIFAMFKFFDLEGFVDGFLMYDLVAKRFKAYAYIYPFIELMLGCLYLSGIEPVMTDLITIVVMFAGAAGIVNSIGKGEDLKCACLGPALNVPLSVVSIIENVGMGFMALVSLAV